MRVEPGLEEQGVWLAPNSTSGSLEGLQQATGTICYPAPVNTKYTKMKLAAALCLVASANAFAPSNVATVSQEFIDGNGDYVWGDIGCKMRVK